MDWATWEAPGSDCADGPQPGARAFMAWALETFPSAFSLGIYNCRPVRGSSAPSTHGEGRADDVGFPMLGGKANPAGYRLVERVGQHGKRLGIQCAIFDRRIWSAKSPEGRYYDGIAPHRDHVHVELNRAAAARLNLATLRAVLGGPEEFDMETIAIIQKALIEAGHDLGEFTPYADGFPPGADGVLTDGGKTYAALVAAFGSAPAAGVPNHKHTVRVPGTAHHELQTSSPKVV